MVGRLPQERVVCFGEILLRLSAVRHGGLLEHPALDAHFGGAEANVAIALARMGTPAAMVSALRTKLMQAGFTKVMDTEAMFAKHFAEFQVNRLLPPV